MAIRERGKGWQADKSVDGKRYRKDFSTRSEAEAWMKAAETAVVRGLPPPVVAWEGAREVTLGVLRERVLAAHWDGTKGEKTARINSKAACDHFGPLRPLSEITTEEVDGYLVALRAKKNTNGTINRKLSALSFMLKFAAERDWIVKVPRMRKKKEAEGRVRFVTREEESLIVATLRHFAAEDAADLVVFLVDTGFRLGEAARFRWSDWTPGGATTWVNKGERPRTVPLTPRCHALLARRKKAGHKVPFEVAQDDRALRTAWDRMRLHLGFDDVLIHTLRHTCASRLVQGGVDIRRVKDWMGHAAITTTMRYAHLAPGNLDAAMQVLVGATEGEAKKAA